MVTHESDRTITIAARVVLSAVLSVAVMHGVLRADAPSQRFGVISHWDGAVANNFAQLGAGVLRTPCNWGDIEPSRGVYTWGCSDDRVLGAAASGVQVLLTVECTPGWANGGGSCDTMPSNFGDWHDFVANLVQHYSGYNVILGVYNEPNLHNISISGYCNLFLNAVSARNGFNAGFRLAGPETSHHAMSDGYYRSIMACIGSSMASQDAVTVHWYDDGPDLNAYLDYVRANEFAGNNVYLSETGKTAGDLGLQAFFYATRMSNMEGSLGLARPWLKKIMFYKMYDGSDGTWGIVNFDNSPRPAFTTLQEWIADEAGTSAGTMHADRYLFQDQQIDSANGQYHLYYQADGNLVLYDQFFVNALWASNTSGTTTGFTVMQGDGNLVVYDGSGQAQYWTGTDGHPGAYAVVQDNSNFFVFDADGTPIKLIH
jgi:putative glycosyl hydrolase